MANSRPVFSFREAVADSGDLVTEHTGANKGAIGPANPLGHAVREASLGSQGDDQGSVGSQPNHKLDLRAHYAVVTVLVHFIKQEQQLE